MTCAHCGNQVPAGEFCTRCGAHASGRHRLVHYAARPGEHVSAPNVASTLLPHLPHARVHVYRWAVLAAVAVVVILAGTGLVTPAIYLAALTVPIAYLAYLRDAEVYGAEPALVLLSTLLYGAAVGVVVTVVADRLGDGLGSGGVLALVTVVAVVAELVKPLGPLFLRRRFSHTVDGLVFGVAAGLGYAVAQTFVNLAGVLGATSLRIDPGSWLFTLLSAAVLIPLMHGSCTGLIAASLWRPRGGTDAALRAAALPLAVVADIAFAAGSEVMDDAGLSPVFVLAWQAVIVIGLLVAIRLLLHAALLDEAHDLQLRQVRCTHCAREVEAANFCPECGASVITARAAVGSAS